MQGLPQVESLSFFPSCFAPTDESDDIFNGMISGKSDDLKSVRRQSSLRICGLKSAVANPLLIAGCARYRGNPTYEYKKGRLPCGFQFTYWSRPDTYIKPGESLDHSLHFWTDYSPFETVSRLTNNRNCFCVHMITLFKGDEVTLFQKGFISTKRWNTYVWSIAHGLNKVFFIVSLNCMT